MSIKHVDDVVLKVGFLPPKYDIRELFLKSSWQFKISKLI